MTMNKNKYLFFAFIGGVIIIHAIYINLHLMHKTEHMQKIFDLNIEMLEFKEVETSTTKKVFDKIIISQDFYRSYVIYPLWVIGFFFLLYSAYLRIHSDSDG